MKRLNLLLLAITLFCIGLTGLNAQTVTDIDGNVYNTVTIGTQTWMKENLKTTKYSNGTGILLVNTSATWDALTNKSKAYCWYDDNINNKDTYGALYTWAAAMNEALSSTTKPSGVQGVCPTGWHLPSDAEWTELETYLGGNSIAGGKLKETGTTHWLSPNLGATNESGFSGLPGGDRSFNGEFSNITFYGYWWSSTEYSDAFAHFRYLVSLNASIDSSYNNKEYGFSVRCLRDNHTSITSSINSEEVILYPNPATEKLYIKNSNYTNGIIIFDLQGKKVLSKQIDSNPIDISNLSKGIYVVKLVCSENVLITKFIKE
jgi:uncharacterized protein (TIGR02145 family)